MLTLIVPPVESWDYAEERFRYSPGMTLELEHTLVSVSKWESLYEKPFLSNEEKSVEETLGYIQAMSSVPIPVEVLSTLSQENLTRINEYIEKKNTATWFKEVPGTPKSREIITAEIIYYWMIALQIPLETENWHLNRLFTLIKVTNEKNQPKKKMSRAEQISQQRQLNAERLAKLQTTG